MDQSIHLRITLLVRDSAHSVPRRVITNYITAFVEAKRREFVKSTCSTGAIVWVRSSVRSIAVCKFGKAKFHSVWSSGSRKTVRAFVVVILASSAKVRPRTSASFAAVKATRAGSFSLPRKG